MKILIKKLLRENLETKKRIFLIHGLEGSYDNHWFPWIKDELINKGFEVKALKMPSPNNPDVSEWVKHIKSEVGEPDINTSFIGHSLGCLGILKYIQSLKNDDKINKCVFVSGFLELDDSKMNSFYLKEIKPEVINRIKSITIIYSDNDEEITIDVSEKFGNELKAKKIMVKNKGHFTNEDNVFELKELIKEF